jgi:hypothetical protein
MEPMNSNSSKKRVLCPVSTKEGKTFWVRMGNAYVNKDNSINLYLDGLPVNGRLQIRDWDDAPWDKKAGSTGEARGHGAEQDELPF